MTEAPEFTIVDPYRWFDLILAEMSDFRKEIAEILRLLHTLAPKRCGFNKATMEQYRRVVIVCYKGWCPCCQKTILFSATGNKLLPAEPDHWRDHPGHSKPHDGWLICPACHSKFTRGIWIREEYRPAFEAFQLHRRNLQGHLPLQVTQGTA